MQARYRKDYAGEFVITETKFANGKKEQTREWIANPITNQHLSARAVCIGSNVDLPQFDYTVLLRHRGGLLGSKKVQTYGISEITENMHLDFTVDTDIKNLQPLVKNKYVEQHIVYTTPRNCITNPGEFYLIPQNPQLTTLALPLYIAAFDGHQEIFLLGYNNDTVGSVSSWQYDVLRVISAYKEVIFTFVGNKTNIPQKWLANSNVRVMSYQEFISYCDI